MKILFWLFIVFIFGAAAVLAGNHDRDDCETRIAKQLNTTAVYINGRCMIKGYGRIN